MADMASRCASGDRNNQRLAKRNFLTILGEPFHRTEAAGSGPKTAPVNFPIQGTMSERVPQ